MKKGVDYIGVGVGACIINSEGKILLGLRSKNSRNEAGTWEIPGGAVEFNERLEDAIKREVREEIGVEIRIIDMLQVCNHIILSEKQHWVSPTYICVITHGEPSITEKEKCDAIGWFTLQEAQNLPLSIVTKEDIHILQQKYPKGLSILVTV